MEDQFLSPVNGQQQAANSLNIKELFFKYVRFLPLFVISVALSLLVAYLYLRYTTPIYKSDGALIVKQDNATGAAGAGGGNDRFQQMFVLDNSINIQNEIEILKSKQLMQRVVDALGLNFNYLTIGNIKKTNNYTSTPFYLEAERLSDSASSFTIKIKAENEFTYRINDEKKLVAAGQSFSTPNGIFKLSARTAALPGTEYEVNWRPTEAVAGELANRVTVVPKGNTGILLIGLEADNPQMAADIINVQMKEYQVVTIQDKNETNRRMLEFIDGRLQGVERELDSVNRRLAAYQRANNLISSETQTATYIGKVEETDEKINEQRVQDNVAGMIDDYLRNRSNAYSLVPSTLGLADGTLNTMIAAYNVSQLERKGLIDANVPESNPRVQQKEDQIERLRINILESLRNLRRSIAASVSRLEQTNSRYRAQVAALPVKEQEMLEIKKGADTKQTLYTLLMEKREQTAIALAGTISNMKVVEQAHSNNTPVKPDRKTIRLIAIVIGLALPALFILLLEMLNDKVNSRRDVEKVTDAPILGEIGHSYQKDPLIVKANNRGFVAEQFRIVRSNLQYFLNHVKKPVILVTSSFSGEGKSYISTNLGAVMALGNRKTIVLEFDIRKPKILSHLGISKKPGITNFLLGKAEAEDLPIPVEGYNNLFVLACGPVPPNPAELLLDPKLDDLFLYLKQNFDVIIIDTAPVGMVSDAMTLGRFADATIYVVRQGHTFKKQLGLINEYHLQGKLPKVSVMVNDVKVQDGYGYYGYGRYGYGYGYGYGSDYFEDNAAPPSTFTKWFGWLEIGKKKNNKKKKNASV